MSIAVRPIFVRAETGILHIAHELGDRVLVDVRCHVTTCEPVDASTVEDADIEQLCPVCFGSGQ